MSTDARSLAPIPARPSRLSALWRSTVGRKAVMAATGVVLFAYVVAHLLGNLQVFAGPDALNRYAALLRAAPGLLWAARVVLLACFLVHVVVGLQLTWAARAARPIAYAEFRPTASSAASRSMIGSGLVLLGFVGYHLADLTFGIANPDFEAHDVFHNLVASLARVGAGAVYLAAMAALGLHLWHGLWSLFQSLGLSGSAAAEIQRFAVGAAVVLALGFAAIPVAVLLGFVR